MTAPPPVRVTIDRLVLHGVAPGDAAAVQRALAAELEAALAGGGPADAVPREHLRLDVATPADPRALGASAGRALGAALAGRPGVAR